MALVTVNVTGDVEPQEIFVVDGRVNDGVVAVFVITMLLITKASRLRLDGPQ